MTGTLIREETTRFRKWVRGDVDKNRQPSLIQAWFYFTNLTLFGGRTQRLAQREAVIEWNLINVSEILTLKSMGGSSD